MWILAILLLVWVPRDWRPVLTRMGSVVSVMLLPMVLVVGVIPLVTTPVVTVMAAIPVKESSSVIIEGHSDTRYYIGTVIVDGWRRRTHRVDG
jgi:hypothetical protein